MSLVVQKYGGSSLATPKHIQRAARRIEAIRRAGTDLVVVVSAMGHTTDHLVRLAKRTVKRPPGRELDMLLTAGERVSMSLLAMALQELGVAAISFTGSQSGIVTDSRHTRARIREIRGNRIRDELSKGKVVIIAGFQGVSEEKEVTTLGRGGSDTTAIALAAVLGADYCEILTDVDGLYTADPRLVANASRIESCSTAVAVEMASLGAKMHPRSLALARRHRVPVRIASSFIENNCGTWIGRSEELKMEEAKVSGVTHLSNLTLVSVNLPWAKAMEWLAQRSLSPRVLQANANGIQFCLDAESATELAADSNSPITLQAAVSLVSIVGEGLEASPQFLREFSAVLVEQGITPHTLSQNALSLSAAVPQASRDGLVSALHRKFINP